MALPTPTGIFDEVNDKIITTNSATWADLGEGDSAGDTEIATWADWKTWITEPATLTWLSEVVDLGESTYFNLEWTIQCVGTPTFTVYTSDTGAFTGEETSTTVNVGDTDIAAFQGQFVVILISVAHVQAEGIPEITSFNYTVTGERYEQQQWDLDSSTLAGSASARTIVMPRAVSKILTMRITPQSGTSLTQDYVSADYVASGYVGETTTQALVPNIVSKTRSAPTVAFINASGEFVDTTFDLEMTVLPEQYMNGRNLSVR